MPFDPAQIKQDFPLLSSANLVYLDSAATSQKPQQVIDAITNYYSKNNANVHRGIYQLSETATQEYEDARETVRAFINAESTEEIIFTSGATHSLNLVAQSWAAKNLKEGDKILISELEHHSNFVPWHILKEKTGVEIEFISVMPNGTLDLNSYRNMINDPAVKMLAITHVSNVLGTINPIKEIVEMAKEKDVTTVVDGAQAVPHMKLDMQDIDCDFYAFSSHKMLGPTGVGALYAKQDLLDEMDPFMFGGDMISMVKKDKVTYNELPWKFEAGTPNMAGVIGLAAAIKYLQSIGMDKIKQHEQELIEYAYSRFQEEFKNGEVTVYGPSPLTNPNLRAGVLPFTIQGTHPHDISSILDEENICVRSGHHCAQPLIDSLEVEALARASFYIYNSQDDIEALIKGIRKVQNIFA